MEAETEAYQAGNIHSKWYLGDGKREVFRDSWSHKSLEKGTTKKRGTIESGIKTQIQISVNIGGCGNEQGAKENI